jgi:hypothetical protein
MEPEGSRAQTSRVLSQINPVHVLPRRFFQINLNIVLPSTPISSNSLSLASISKRCLFHYHFPEELQIVTLLV